MSPLKQGWQEDEEVRHSLQSFALWSQHLRSDRLQMARGHLADAKTKSNKQLWETRLSG